MTRIKLGKVTRRRRRKYLKMAKGYWGARGRLYRQARESVEKALKHSYRGRKLKKRDFRSLWITRVSNFCKLNGISYSKFMNALKKNNVILNRKMLGEVVLQDPQAFKKIVDFVMT
ncbi:MAG: 50S ribosomal protein L20 [Caldiserica bacterium]|nr:MAG: 50S ribosomal protein L20 [Caldisericota bacterium]